MAYYIDVFKTYWPMEEYNGQERVIIMFGVLGQERQCRRWRYSGQYWIVWWGDLGSDLCSVVKFCGFGPVTFSEPEGERHSTGWVPLKKH